MKLKVEFITSFETSDDTLNRFLGSELACNRIEAFELLLKRTVTVPILINRSGAEIGAALAAIQKKKIKARTLPIRIKNELLAVKIPPPEIFFYHKAITFVMRSEDFKRDKDLFYAYFMLKFHPDKAALLAALAGLKNDEYFSAFRENILEYLSDFASQGYLILRPFLRGWIEEGSINEEIQNTFKEIFELF